VYKCHSLAIPERKKKKKNYASSKKLLTSIKERGPLGRKSPFTRKRKGESVRKWIKVVFRIHYRIRKGHCRCKAACT